MMATMEKERKSRKKSQMKEIVLSQPDDVLADPHDVDHEWFNSLLQGAKDQNTQIDQKGTEASFLERVLENLVGDGDASAPILEESSHPVSFISSQAESAEEITEHVKYISLSEEITPYKESQLFSLYPIPKLDEVDQAVEDFLKKELVTQGCHFYQLTLNYLLARSGLKCANEVIQDCEDDCRKLSKDSWQFKTEMTTGSEKCDDGQTVSYKEYHETAHYSQSSSEELSKQLKKLREIAFESHSLHSYKVEMMRLEIEDYLHDIIKSCPEFEKLPKFSSVVCLESNTDAPHYDKIVQLKECISVLFSFLRRNLDDKIFLDDVKKWVTELISILLRFSSCEDHYFLLNHLLRLPAGSADWSHKLLQVVPPISQGVSLGSPALEHAIAVISLILRPIKEREKFLHHFKPAEPSGDVDDGYVVIDDANGTEIDVMTTWSDFEETDVIQFLDQIPFDDLFKHLLLMRGDSDSYDIARTTPGSFLKLLSFCTRLLKVLSHGVYTYGSSHMEAVVKRIARLIRHMLLYITDHWEEFKQFQARHPNQSEDDSMMVRLQVEYDEYFERTVKAMFNSPRCAAWQFLADIPFHSLSCTKLAKIAYDLHVGYKVEAFYDIYFTWEDMLSKNDTKERFFDHVKNLCESDSYYLLNSLCNIASCRSIVDRIFIENIVSNVFEVSFAHTELKEKLHRAGRDLLSGIVTHHPFVVSTILHIIHEKIGDIGSLALYLFKFLDLSRWKTSETDFKCLTYWILAMPSGSLENQFARCVLEKLNWGFMKGKLHLPLAMHHKLALILLEAHADVSSKEAGNLITEGIKTVTSVISAASQNAVFLDWCWSMLQRLKLHKMDQSPSLVQQALVDPSLMLDGVRDLSSAQDLDLMRKGTISKDFIAIYTSLLMTTWGHSIPEFCKEGLTSLKVLVEAGRLEAAITILSLTTPLFFNQHQDLTSDPKFILIVSTILSSDQTYLNLAKSLVTREKSDEWQKLFTAMIVTQIQDYEKYNAKSPAVITNFWFHALTSIPYWKSNDSVLRTLDVMCELAILDEEWRKQITDILVDQIKPGEQLRMLNAISSMFNWVVATQVDETKSLLVRYSNPDVPWFSLVALLAEVQVELSSGLWKNLLMTLHSYPTYSIDCALKRSCEDLTIPIVQSNSLCIYRLGQQVLDLHQSHPAFLATLQAFLTLHLSRGSTSFTNGESFCVTQRFYEGYINGQFLKRIQTKASEAYDSSSQDMMEIQASLDKEHDLQTVKKLDFAKCRHAFLHAAINWLEDERLFDGDLYIPALPPYFLTNKLQTIFNSNFKIWTENVDESCIESHRKGHLKVWEKYRLMNAVVIASPSRRKPSIANAFLYRPSENILRRLREYDAPKSPPPLPSKRLTQKTNKDFDIESILFRVDHFTGIAVERASSRLLWSRELCAVDCVYMEILPNLWSNIDKESVTTVECIPGRSSKIKQCTGPALIELKFQEKKLDNATQMRIDHNRQHHTSLLNELLQAPQQKFCQASIELRTIVDDVCEWHTKNLQENNEQQIKTGFLYGRKLFYHLVDLVTEDNSSYGPFKQLISSCVETLGRHFIQNQEDCQEELAQHVLEFHHSKGSLLSPHFSPMSCRSFSYVELYKSLAPYACREPEKVFMLMSKFQLENAISNDFLGFSEQKIILESIFQVTSSLLSQKDPSVSIVLELYRIHLQNILTNDFESHYRDYLDFLLEVALEITEDPFNIAVSLWYDYLNIMSRGTIIFRPDMPVEQVAGNIDVLASTLSKLNPEQVLSMSNFLKNHFLKNRLVNGLRGLYSVYKAYTRPMAILIGILTCRHICSVHDHCIKDNISTPNSQIWSFIESMWLPWVSPLGGESKESLPEWVKQLSLEDTALLPWRQWDLHEQSFTVSVFMICVKYLHKEIKHAGTLQRLLEYYARTFAKSSIKEHVLSVIHAQFSTMPWVSMNVVPRDLEIMSKIMNEYLPECHSFIGHMFLEFQWPDILSSYVLAADNRPDDPQRQNEARRVHTLVLNILMRISFEPSVRSNGGLRPLLEKAEHFAWRFVESDSYDNILNWFVMSSDPRIILNWEKRTPIDVAALKLMHVAAGYVPGTTHHPEYTHMKRLLFVRCLARFFKTIADRFKQCVLTQPQLFIEAFCCMLSHMEDTVLSAIPLHRQIEEGTELASELMVVVGNNTLGNPLQDICRDASVNWLKGHHMSHNFLLSFINCVCRGVLQLHYRSPILDGAIRSVIDHCNQQGTPIPWDDVLKNLYFPATSPMPLLTYCAQENQLLVFYAYVKWRVDVKGVPSGDEGLLLSNFIEALCFIQCDNTSDIGLVLVLGEILKLLVVEVRRTGENDVAWAHTSKLIEILKTLGDDSGSKGFFAAIGLGRKPMVTPKTRLFLKCLAMFLQYQVASPGVFVSETTDISDNEKREFAHQVQMLTKDSAYVGLKPAIDLVTEHCDSISRYYVKHSFKFYLKLVSSLFDGEPAFQHLSKK